MDENPVWQEIERRATDQHAKLLGAQIALASIAGHKPGVLSMEELQKRYSAQDATFALLVFVNICVQELAEGTGFTGEQFLQMLVNSLQG